jgi:hypothetical protein
MIKKLLGAIPPSLHKVEERLKAHHAKRAAKNAVFEQRVNNGRAQMEAFNARYGHSRYVS